MPSFLKPANAELRDWYPESFGRGLRSPSENEASIQGRWLPSTG
jgi:hypothetical protein